MSDLSDNLLFGHMALKWIHKTLHTLDPEVGGNALK